MAKIDEILTAANSRPVPVAWSGIEVTLPDLPADTTAPRSGLYRNGLKRAFDTLIILLAAPFVLPIIAIGALLVMLDGGPAFYTQERVGRGGRIFRMWKLRTMAVDADRILEDLLASDPALRREWNHSQKLRHDPRITRVGRILRKTSLDELPQLFNVLTGDMSIVGPRPMMPDQQAMYSGKSYYRLRPGVTGLWQVSQRNLTSFADRARFDAAYDSTLSLLGDLRLMLATVRVVFRGTGC